MYHVDQCVTIALTDPMMEVVREHARRADIGGRSQITADRGDRQECWQLVGQMAEAALYLWAGLGFAAYDANRRARNLRPHAGDAGYDAIVDSGPLESANKYTVDVKASTRNAYMAIPEYHLPVRPKEVKAARYVFALSDPTTDEVVLVGWTTKSIVKQTPITQSGPFKGAHAIKWPVLYPLCLWDLF